MKNKRNLLEELNISGHTDVSGPYCIDIQRVKAAVNNSIDSANSERKSGIMKSKKKISLIAIAATFILGITVFAASGFITTWYSSSSSIPEYTSLPTEVQVTKDIGYVVTLIEEFKNGYAFKNGSVINNNLADAGDKSVESFKSVMFRYENDGDTVNYSQERFKSFIDNDGEVAAKIDGIDVYYHSYTSKIVPPDYKKTDEDIIAEENGDLVFSWGAEKVDVLVVQSISWIKDGVHHSLMQMDGKLSEEDLVAMAEEAILR